MAKKEKRKSKKWIVALILIIAIGAGSVFIYNNFFSEQAKYQKEIKEAYKIADQNLLYSLNTFSRYGGLDRNKKIEYMMFSKETQDPTLIIYFQGDYYNGSLDKYRTYDGYATFKVKQEDYNNLISSQEKGNILDYINTLNTIFDTMKYIDSNSFHQIDCINYEYVEKTEENIEMLLNLFNLEVEDNNIVRQVGFFPYNIEVIKWEMNEETKILNYTYLIRGISYCETKEASTADVVEDENLIMYNNYDSTHLKAYYRDIYFSSWEDLSDHDANKQTRFQGDINKYKYGKKTKKDFQVETKYFEETTLFENFYKMQNGYFKFKKPNE